MSRSKNPMRRRLAALAAIVLVLAGVWIPSLQTTQREPSPPDLEPPAQVKRAPLTDIAPEPPPLAEPPQRRTDLDLPPLEAPTVLPPQDMDVRNPPQWTTPIALPAAYPSPPDPFTPPPIKVDPKRKPKPEIQRRTLTGAPDRAP